VELSITPHTWWGYLWGPTWGPQCTCYRHYDWPDSLFLLPCTHTVCGAKWHMELSIISHKWRGYL